MDSLYSRYASALLSIALEENKVDFYKEEIKMLKKLFSENEDILHLFSSCFILDEDKNKVLDEIYPNDENIKNFIKIVIKNRRVRYLNKIFDEFIKMCNEQSGVKEGIIYSANELEENQIKKIEEAVQTKLKSKVSLQNIVDKKLIGGIKIVVEDKVFDGSIKNKIEKLQEDLIKGGY